MSILRPSVFRPIGEGSIVHLPFERAVEMDLAAGVDGPINRACGTDKPLELILAEPVGDLHAYFRIVDPGGRVGGSPPYLAFIAADGGEEKRFLECCDINEIDNQARAIIKEYDDGEGLFQNHTRRVLFRGGRDTFETYYKYGFSLEAEIQARMFLDQFDVKTPAIFPSTAPYSCWLKNVPGQLWGDLLAAHNRNGSRIFAQMDQSAEKSAAFFEMIGRSFVLMFLLGNNDGHYENFICSEQGDGVSLDWEILGQHLPGPPRELPGKTIDLDFARVGREFIDYSRGLFKDGYSGPWLHHAGDYGCYLARGARQVFEACADEKTTSEYLMALCSEDFYTRAIMCATACYMNVFGMNIIPHYSIEIKADDFKRFMQDRLNHLSRLIATHKVVWDDRPSLQLLPATKK